MTRRAVAAAVAAAGLLLGGCGGERASVSALGTQVRISAMGPDGDPRYTAGAPAVAYDSHANRYLVVWAGNDERGRNEVWGRLLGPDARPLGPQFRISRMGRAGNPGGEADSPALAYDPGSRRYLVVWRGDRLVDDEFEIFASRVSADADVLDPDGLRLSDMGPEGDRRFGAFVPAVAAGQRGWLVVWRGNDDDGRLADGEREIFAQRLAPDGAETGANDARISSAGPDGDSRFGANFPAVTHNARADEWLVAWSADDSGGDDELEIVAQRLSDGGLEIGADDFRLSDAGPPGDPRFAARTPALAWSAGRNEYLVAWWGDDETDEELEIFGQRLTARGEQTGADDFRISRAGAEGDTRFGALVPSVASADEEAGYLVAWWGDTGEPPLEDDEAEVFVRFVPGSGTKEPDPGVRVSRMGPDAEYLYAAVDPAVAYNSRADEWLVAWLGDEPGPPLADNDFEVFVRRVGR